MHAKQHNLAVDRKNAQSYTVPLSDLSVLLAEIRSVRLGLSARGFPLFSPHVDVIKSNDGYNVFLYSDLFPINVAQIQLGDPYFDVFVSEDNLMLTQNYAAHDIARIVSSFHVEPKHEKSTLDDLLEGINVPEDRRDAVKEFVEENGIRDLECITHTSTGFVACGMDQSGRILYAKIGYDKKSFEKEAAVMSLLWDTRETRAITPRLHALKNFDDDLGVLITLGTQNIGIVDQSDFDSYRQLRKKMFDSFNKSGAKKMSLFDPHAIDAYNRALKQAVMRSHKGDEMFQKNRRPIMFPFEKLVDRASRTREKDYFSFLLSTQKLYESALQSFEKTPSSGVLTVIEFDARPYGNVFRGVSPDLRPTGDFQRVQTGFPETDIFKLESGDDSKYVGFFVHCIRELTRYFGREVICIGEKKTEQMKQKVAAGSVLHTIRTLSGELALGSPRAKDYARLAQVTSLNYLRRAG